MKDAQANDALRRAYTSAARLNAFLIQSLGRKPGEAMDDTDVRLYQRELYPLLDAIRTGRLVATFEPASDGTDMPAVDCSPPIWEVIHFIRGAEFRPGFDAVGKNVRQSLGLAIETVPGGEADARRVISAPLRLPWGPRATTPPIDPDAPWIKRFAHELARGDDSFDSALLTVLAHLPTDAARDRAITELTLARDATAAQKASQSEGAERAQASRTTEKTALQTALETIAALRSKENTRQ